METLDEAAFNYVDLKLTETKDRKCLPSNFFAADVEKAFKAGALWMAKQHAGEISECTEKSFNEGVKYAVDKAVEWLSTSKMLVESGIVDKFKEAMNETKCTGCNNIKGCVTCTDGDQYAHITEIK